MKPTLTYQKYLLWYPLNPSDLQNTLVKTCQPWLMWTNWLKLAICGPPDGAEEYEHHHHGSIWRSATLRVLKGIWEAHYRSRKWRKMGSRHVGRVKAYWHVVEWAEHAEVKATWQDRPGVFASNVTLRWRVPLDWLRSCWGHADGGMCLERVVLERVGRVRYLLYQGFGHDLTIIPFMEGAGRDRRLSSDKRRRRAAG